MNGRLLAVLVVVTCSLILGGTVLAHGETIELSIRLGETNHELGLHLGAEGDFDTEVVNIHGVEARSTGNGQVLPSQDGNEIRDTYMQFDVDDGTLFEGAPTQRVQIIVEYLDIGMDSFVLQYDASGTGGAFGDGRFTSTEKVWKTGSGEMRAAIFDIEDAYFGNRDNGADFRIDDLRNGPEVIHSVAVLLVGDRAAGDPARFAVAAGLTWLRTVQNANGSWNFGENPSNVGVTALCAMAFKQNGSSMREAALRNALQFLIGQADHDGKIVSEGSGWHTYETALAAFALDLVGDRGDEDTVLAARGWLAGVQNWIPQSYPHGLACLSPSDCWAHGGWGYGASSVSNEGHAGTTWYVWSDLSITQFALLALETDPGSGWSRAAAEAWVRRCQDAAGGFGYQPRGADHGWGQESFGSTTAAGINSLLSLGINPPDDAIDPAVAWLEANFTVEENPWHGLDRHYYYLWSVARSFRRLTEMTDLPEMQEFAQRGLREIQAYLIGAQWPDGRWRNVDDAHTEPPADILVTAYALNALAECAEME